MTQQQFQPQFPGYPAPPQQPYQQPAYAPPPQQYAPQGYPQQGYPQQPQAPAQPLAQGSLDDFYNQPSSGGGPSLKFEQLNTRYIGIVSRPLGPGDVQQQTNTQGVPLFFKDGRPKWVMKVPLQMQPTAEYPDGQAQWYVKGAARDELTRAMAEAGAPAGPPEQGAVIDITFVSTRNSGAGMNPAKVFRVAYQRPQGAGAASPVPAPAQPVEAPQVQQQAPAQQQYQPAPQAAPQGVDFSQLQQPQAPQQGIQLQLPQQGFQQQAAPAQPTAAPAAPAQAQPQLQAPANLSAEQAELLARLTGAQQGG